MCCSYCIHFDKCTKKQKIKYRCCSDCQEYDFCPSVHGRQIPVEIDISEDIEELQDTNEIEILEDEELT